jgi:hypothetical protein
MSNSGGRCSGSRSHRPRADFRPKPFGTFHEQYQAGSSCRSVAIVLGRRRAMRYVFAASCPIRSIFSGSNARSSS